MISISTVSVKEYNGPKKDILYINGIPICVARKRRIHKLIQYAFKGEPVPKDGKIKRHIDYLRKEDETDG